MKKIVFILILEFFLGLNNLYAQDAELIVEGNTYLATQGGNVGIGTTTPSQKLTVNGNIDMVRGQLSGIHSAGGVSFDWTTGGTYDHVTYHGIQSRNEVGNWADSLRVNSFDNTIVTLDSDNNDSVSYLKVQHHSSTNGEDLFNIASGGVSYIMGNVGIGMVPSARKLEVNGDAYFTGNLYVDNKLQVGGTIPGTNCAVFGKGPYGIIGHGGNDPLASNGVAGVMLVASDPSQFTGGIVGQGPTRGVHGRATGIGGIGLRGNSSSSTGRGVVAYASSTSGVNHALMARTNSITNGWAGTFYGKIRCNSSYGLTGAAYIYPSNYFDIAEEIYAQNCEAGDVVIVDPDNNESVIKSSKPYQTSIAGIISTSPIFYINDAKIDDEKGKPLALKGRVLCKATTENGPIKRGDILVTSSKPGYAMKADLNKVNACMILGKALEPLGQGEGKIIVFIK